jgi:subtilisin family serine protease
VPAGKIAMTVQPCRDQSERSSVTAHRLPKNRRARLAVVTLATLLLTFVPAKPASAQAEPPAARSGPSSAVAGPSAPTVVEPAPGETTRVIVELATPTRPPAELAPVEEAAQEQAIAATQAEVAVGLDDTGAEVVATFDQVPGMAVEATAEGLDQLRSDPDVVAVRPDGVVRPLLDVSTALVRADEAWPDADGTGYSVAIIDTGVDGGHDFLDTKVVHEACFADDTIPNNAPAGDCPNGQSSQTGTGAAVPCAFAGCDHGTHVAGIATSDGDPGEDAVSYPGVAKGATIVAEQVFHNDAGGALAYFSDIVEALNDVYSVRDDHAVAAVNMSLGGFLFDTFCDDQIEPLMFDAVQNLKDEGIPTVVASGNDGVVNALSFPACLSNVISVGSVISGKDGSQADGIAFDSNAAPFLRLLAPGSPITSAQPDATAPRNDTRSRSGTSMAAPHVAGAIAVLREAGVGEPVDEVDRADRLHGVVRASGVCLEDPGNGIGYARLDVRAAIDWAGLPSALFWDIDCDYWAQAAIDWLGFDPDGTLGPAQPLAAGFTDGTFRPTLPITRAQDARMLHRLFGEPDPAPYAHSFVDVPAWVDDAVDWVNWPGGPASPDPLMTGTGNRFKPNANITRGEKARQLYRAAGSLPRAQIELQCPSHPFTDVPPWVDDAVLWLTCPAFGPDGTTAIATGYGDNTFRPNNPITRAQTARMLERFDQAGHVT